jgi:hypothetical protein
VADAPSVTGSAALIIAGFGFLGVTVAPIALALINRGGKSKEVSPEVAVPRTEYDNLLEQLTRLDDENDRLGRENARQVVVLHEREVDLIRCGAEMDLVTREKTDLQRELAELKRRKGRATR